MRMYDDDTLSSDDLILGPWYSTLAYLHAHQIKNNDNPVTWMLYDTDSDYVIFKVQLGLCTASYTQFPTHVPSPAPSHDGFVRPSASPTASPAPTLAPSAAEADSAALHLPNSGSVFQAGEEANITWSFTGDPGLISLFLFRGAAYDSKIVFMMDLSDENSTCDRNGLLHHQLDDRDECIPVVRGDHETTFLWTVPIDTEGRWSAVCGLWSVVCGLY